MNTTTSPDEMIRQRLDARARTLEAEIAAARVPLADVSHEVGDRKDEAEESQREAVADAGLDRDLAELREITAARVRLDEGRYGHCADCEESIDAARLAAQPAALRCIRCQRAVERLHVK